MRSSIIQVSQFPINADSYISPGSYPHGHWFLSHVADRVESDNNRARTLERVKKCLCNNDAPVSFFRQGNNEGFELREGFRTAYFLSRYSEFRKELLSLNEQLSLEAYSDGTLGDFMFNLNCAYKDEYGIYIDGNGTLDSLDTFLRMAKIGARYYFGGTVDYYY